MSTKIGDNRPRFERKSFRKLITPKVVNKVCKSTHKTRTFLSTEITEHISKQTKNVFIIKDIYSLHSTQLICIESRS